MKIKSFLAVIALMGAITAVAQTAPIFPKKWKGTSTHAFPDKTSNNSLLSTVVPATYEVIKQDGRNLLLLFKSAVYQGTVIGTLSADGKHLEIAYKNGSGHYVVNGNTISGCGSDRVANKSLQDWQEKYSTWCDEFTAVD